MQTDLDEAWQAAKAVQEQLKQAKGELENSISKEDFLVVKRLLAEKDDKIQLLETHIQAFKAQMVMPKEKKEKKGLFSGFSSSKK